MCAGLMENLVALELENNGLGGTLPPGRQIVAYTVHHFCLSTLPHIVRVTGLSLFTLQKP